MENTFSLSDSLNGIIDMNSLNKSFRDAYGSDFNGICKLDEGDIYAISWFANPRPSSEYLQIVGAHTGVPLPAPLSFDEISTRLTNIQETISIEKKILNKGNFKVLSRYIFKGGSAVSFSTNSYMDTNATSYSIRVFDITNNQLVLETSLTNTATDAITSMGTAVWAAPDRAIWEIQGKVDGGTGAASAYLDGIIIDYNQ